MEGWIKLHRKVKNWEWYSDKNTRLLFFHLLLAAAYEPCIYRGYNLKPGQIVTGRTELAKETGLTEREVRTCLQRLKTTSELTIKTTSKNSLITLIKWEDYQGGRDENDQQNDQQNDQKTTTSKEVKKLRNNPPTPRGGTAQFFEEKFWLRYPKHQRKEKALCLEYWKRHKLDTIADSIADGLDRYTRTEAWLKDGGRYVVYPIRFLKRRKWEDSIQVSGKKAPIDRMVKAFKQGKTLRFIATGSEVKASELVLIDVETGELNPKTPTGFARKGDTEKRGYFRQFTVAN